ncbi:MAG: phosphotransferase family protein [Lachnospiraceae bacterium]|nr:phosphotransferase family protein [Lachnospiraceae bacterium]
MARKNNNLNLFEKEARDIISQIFDIDEKNIKNISMLKRGMTNRSFKFEVDKNKYIIRIPGEGTEFLINRNNEADVYNTIKGKGICDDTVYLNPQNGYKITKYLDGVRTCNPYDNRDLKLCMKKLKDFHNLKLIVNHEFDIFGQINFYEKLWEGHESVYNDYETTKKNIFNLKKYIDKQMVEKCLTHIDAVADNFLFYNENGEEKIQLTDWEYAGMQDPHVDIAMFCIYSMYDRNQVENLIDIYFDNKCEEKIRIKIYCYIAACGLLWSNWCEYKRHLGIEFGEYSLRQYKYAKEYYSIVKKKMEEM